MTFTPGQTAYYDRALKVQIVRDLKDGRVIVAVGADTRIVDSVTLSFEEA